MNNNATRPPGPRNRTMQDAPEGAVEDSLDASIIDITWRRQGIPWDWHDDLLAYAEHMRHDPGWRIRWHWNDDWLYDAEIFDHDDVLHDPHGVGTCYLNVDAWFTELEENPSEVSPVFKLLTLCWKFRHTNGAPAPGPLKQDTAEINPYTIVPGREEQLQHGQPTIDTAMPSGRNEQLHGNPVAVTNVHVGTELVYTGTNEHWWFADPPLPAFEPNTRLWVTKINRLRNYKLENGNHTITVWLGARQLRRFLNKDILCIVPSARLDALRSGPRRH